MNQRNELDTSQCLRLLGHRGLGRAAVTTLDGPHIVPVNYAVLDGKIAVRTSPYSILGTYGRSQMVAFEVDEVDTLADTGWSVSVRGRFLPETDPKTLLRLRNLLPDSWGPGERSLYLRLPLDGITGRWVGPALTIAPRAVGES